MILEVGKTYKVLQTAGFLKKDDLIEVTRERTTTQGQAFQGNSAGKYFLPDTWIYYGFAVNKYLQEVTTNMSTQSTAQYLQVGEKYEILVDNLYGITREKHSIITIISEHPIPKLPSRLFIATGFKNTGWNGLSNPYAPSDLYRCFRHITATVSASQNPSGVDPAKYFVADEQYVVLEDQPNGILFLNKGDLVTVQATTHPGGSQVIFKEHPNKTVSIASLDHFDHQVPVKINIPGPTSQQISRIAKMMNEGPIPNFNSSFEHKELDCHCGEHLDSKIDFSSRSGKIICWRCGAEYE